MHAGAGGRGVFRVRRGTNALARLIAAVMRMPLPAERVPITLDVERSADGERWTRAFAGQPLVTLQWQRDGLLVEGMGLVCCFFRLRAEGGSLVFEQVRASLGLGRVSIPLPRFLSPRVVGRADPERDDVRVDVRIHAPVVGLLVAYDGLVTPGTGEVAA